MCLEILGRDPDSIFMPFLVVSNDVKAGGFHLLVEIGRLCAPERQLQEVLLRAKLNEIIDNPAPCKANVKLGVPQFVLQIVRNQDLVQTIDHIEDVL